MPLLPFRRPGAAQPFEALLRPHLDYLYRLAWRFSGNAADAEDLVQDVLLKLYPRVEELSRIERLRPWLARVLYRQFIDLLRRRARAPVVEPFCDDEGEDALETLPAPDGGPEEHAERLRLQQRIAAALNKLNPEQRSVIVLHDIEGYRLEELVDVLESPLGTVKSRLHRARERLRELLRMEPFPLSERVRS